jgi:hypothetical protein
VEKTYIYIFCSKETWRVYQMEGEKPRKTIGETIRKDLKVNGFAADMIYDRMLYRWCSLRCC